MPAAAFYRPGPSQRSFQTHLGNDDDPDAPQVLEARTASAPDAQGTWTLAISQRPWASADPATALEGKTAEGSPPPAPITTPITTLRLRQDPDGSIRLLEVINHERGTRSSLGSEQDPGAGLVIAPAQLVPNAPAFTARGVALSGDLPAPDKADQPAAPPAAPPADPPTNRWRGSAVATAQAFVDPTDQAGPTRVRLSLRIGAGPAVILRESELTLSPDPASAQAWRVEHERSTLRVSVGPLTIDRRVREATPLAPVR